MATRGSQNGHFRGYPPTKFDFLAYPLTERPKSGFQSGVSQFFKKLTFFYLFRNFGSFRYEKIGGDQFGGDFRGFGGEGWILGFGIYPVTRDSYLKYESLVTECEFS